ncbi:hypothetical protein LRAMOSA07488 [Lichtheimia ramosa]|uniref:Auxin efflux carrier n=1 Tax=Lichtheimia ramosa TaxID=688394 RepID=A0A077WCZ5_9FUNG|nr:hypothetical protein LRAMOSA07488 [Lichtheimia ramosa]
MGIFTMDKQKWLSKTNLVFFTPCLLFSNIASTISIQKLCAYWPIPAFYLTFAFVSWLLAHVVSRMAGLSPQYRRFVLACSVFGNTNSMPIAIITSLAVSEAGQILFWDADDSQEFVAARGISYTLFYAIFGNLLRWSYGYGLLQKTEQEEQQEHDMHARAESGKLHDGTDIIISKGYGSCSPIQDEQQDGRRQQGRMPDRRSSSLTLTAATDQDGQEEDDVKPSYATPETTQLLASFPTLPADMDDSHKSTSHLITDLIMQAGQRIHRFMSPPLYAAFLALVVGLTPLKHLLYAKESFLYPCLTKAIENCGRAAVPLILTTLGAQLYIISTSQHSAAPAMMKPVISAILVRMVIMPFVVAPITIAFVIYGARISLLATDPVFITMMVVLGCSPTAINLVQITQVNGVFEEEMLRMLFWTYGVVCIPVCTAVVFLGLTIVDKVMLY